MSIWSLKKLSDIATIVPGFAFKSKDFGETGEPVIKIKNISSSYIGTCSYSYVDIGKYNKFKLSKFLAHPGEVVLAMTGATIGKSGVIRQTPVLLNQRVCVVRASENSDQQFINYIIYSDNFKKYILNHLDSETAQPNIGHNTLLKYEFLCPSLNIQHKISSILSAFDDKIEINNKIIANLEEQEQALYKSWFVDFDPFQDGEFEDSELGMMPKGWEVKPLGDLIDIKYGKAHKKLNDGPIPAYGSGGLMRLVDTAICDKESVLIPRKGTLNNIMYVDEPFWVVDTMFFSIPKIDHILKYVYFVLLQIDFASLNVGSAVPSMTIQILNSLKIVIPDDKWILKFNDFIEPLLSNKSLLRKQNQTLAEMRDALLPKLMSGEIELPNEAEE